jgi:hypothetical protein
MNIKTHMVLDTFYSEDEGQETFCGSLKECQDFVNKQIDSVFPFYVIRPLTEQEKIQYND